jgi:2-keto-4-pentenoate hydratase/2-oxohepta-3-ene-1,7-dioic acid hydratase in catechol pathway
MKIFCVGRNYAEHAKELGNAIPEDPVIFMKPSTALLQPNTSFYYPEFTKDLHYELELVLRIAKNGKHIPERDAHAYYDAITVGIDFTARDVQAELKKKGLPWEKAKAWDHSAVLGDWVPLTEDLRKHPIHFTLKKNQQIVQHGDSSDMIFSFDKLISHISNYFTLNIGDLIYTGTPAGVGACAVGDELEGFLADDQKFGLEIQ